MIACIWSFRTNSLYNPQESQNPQGIHKIHKIHKSQAHRWSRDDLSLHWWSSWWSPASVDLLYIDLCRLNPIHNLTLFCGPERRKMERGASIVRLPVVHTRGSPMWRLCEEDYLIHTWAGLKWNWMPVTTNPSWRTSYNKAPRFIQNCLPLHGFTFSSCRD